LVVVKGTEFFDGKQCRYVDMPVTDVLQMMGRAGRPQFDDTGVACVFVHEPKKTFYKKFLHEPFPVESSLHEQLHDHLNAEISAGSLTCVQDCIDYLTWTYYYRRLVMNPAYYGLTMSPEGNHAAGTCCLLCANNAYYLSHRQLNLHVFILLSMKFNLSHIIPLMRT
jgi:replicative superfamily II helicase